MNGSATMNVYLEHILPRVPQILSQIDREPFSKTYGSGDRVHWCWKFTDFPGARFQEYVFTLAWLYTDEAFKETWQGNTQILRMLESGFRYWSKIQYPDGSFDEAYPFEHSLAATAFTMFYLTEGYKLVRDDLSKETRLCFVKALLRSAEWMCHADETHGILSNHLAVASAALYNAGDILGNRTSMQRSEYFLKKIYDHQSPEGWYEEYGGADIGYQTHGSFYLARIWQMSRDDKLLDSLRRANGFIKHFIHPDGSIGGEYSSRNTMFYYPAAFEMLSDVCPAASAIAEFQRSSIHNGHTVGIEQMDAYNLFPVLNNYIFAHLNTSGSTEADSPQPVMSWAEQKELDFPDAGMFIKNTSRYYAVVGGKKGGVIRVWDTRKRQLVFQSSGYTVEMKGKWLSNQSQGVSSYSCVDNTVTVSAPFVAVNQKTFSPLLFMAFRLFTITFGRNAGIARLVKNTLVKVLVKRKKVVPLKLSRKIVFHEDHIDITDELSDKSVRVSHGDKFSTFHMGSSRYVDVVEEQLRGKGYPTAQLTFDPQGVLKSGKITFS